MSQLLTTRIEFITGVHKTLRLFQAAKAYSLLGKHRQGPMLKGLCRLAGTRILSPMQRFIQLKTLIIY